MSQSICQLLLFAVVLAAGSESSPASERSRSRPNVLLMMVDDLGFSDIGCYGSEIETPHLDRLARDGIRFTQFYNCAKCETTRATLLSGRYYAEVGNRKLENCITLAEGMKRGGYRTMMTGKWHLEGEPTDRGFDHYFGHLSGATNFFTGDNTFRLGKKNFDVPGSGFYTTDANVDYALRFLEESDREQPFFLYVAFNAPHYPLQAPEKDVRKYIGRYSKGWDHLRAERFRRQQQAGLLPAGTRLTARPQDVPAWETLSEKQKTHEDLMMATFAGMVDRVDQNIGRLLAYLEETKQLENTLILFLSDNGACPFQRSKKDTVDRQLKPWDPESYWTYDKGWAHAGNTPFREYKQNQHEGGINTPFIAHWPQGIDGKLKGSIQRSPAHLVDIMPTLLEIAETQYPATHAGKPIGPSRGVSLSPAFRGDPISRSQPLLFSFYGKNNACRMGDWKIVNRDFKRFELFDLSRDRTEMQDLSESEPAKFRELKTVLEKEFQAVGFAVKKKGSGKKNNRSRKNGKSSSAEKKPTGKP